MAGYHPECKKHPEQTATASHHPEVAEILHQAMTGHHATQGDALGIKPLSEFCARQKGVLQLLFEILDAGGEDAAVLRRWASA